MRHCYACDIVAILGEHEDTASLQKSMQLFRLVRIHPVVCTPLVRLYLRSDSRYIIGDLNFLDRETHDLFLLIVDDFAFDRTIILFVG